MPVLNSCDIIYSIISFVTNCPPPPCSPGTGFNLRSNQSESWWSIIFIATPRRGTNNLNYNFLFKITKPVQYLICIIHNVDETEPKDWGSNFSQSVIFRLFDRLYSVQCAWSFSPIGYLYSVTWRHMVQYQSSEQRCSADQHVKPNCKFSLYHFGSQPNFIHALNPLAFKAKR